MLSTKSDHNVMSLASSLLISLLSSLFFKITEAQFDPSYLSYNCQNTSTFTPNSTYQTNLNHLLTYFTSNATKQFFYSATIGGGQASNTVQGLFLCRGDVDTTICRDCVAVAARQVVERCPTEKEAIIWFEECFLLYSYRTNIFGTLEEEPSTGFSNKNDVSDPNRFNEVLGETLKGVAAQAANGNGSGKKKFGTREVNYTEYKTLYTLVQCTPDLSSGDCTKCLIDGIAALSGCCAASIGASIFYPSCDVRYGFNPHYYPNTSALSSSPIVKKGKRDKKSSVIIYVIIVSIVVCILLLGIGFYILCSRARKKKTTMRREIASLSNDITTIHQSLQFDFKLIEAATSNFSDINKLGQGGFGEVYKGTLPNGQQIAVKRLSNKSIQGAQEFKNEVISVAKLQHRNLVRLLGFCLEGDEKILVFEYAPNKTLDHILFDPSRQSQLNWSFRLNIIQGIVRGMLYLHEDSRLTVIHRDLKARNILLDSNMNPKISDFGTAKMFQVDQSRANTRRIAGTFGYMAPEYVVMGFYSTKSDVFSFGVLLLEILSGKRNSEFREAASASNIIAHAWKLWSEEKGLELMDPMLIDSCPPDAFIRHLYVGLWCVQQHPDKRPTMSLVLHILRSNEDITSFSQLERPAFSREDFSNHHQMHSSSHNSANELTISDIMPR